MNLSLVTLKKVKVFFNWVSGLVKIFSNLWKTFFKFFKLGYWVSEALQISVENFFFFDYWVSGLVKVYRNLWKTYFSFIIGLVG